MGFLGTIGHYTAQESKERLNVPNSALPDHLKGTKHTDFPQFLQWVPRAWTSYLLIQPPALVWGNQKNFAVFRMFIGNSFIRTGDGWLTHWNMEFFGPDPIPDPLLTGGFAWGIYGI